MKFLKILSAILILSTSIYASQWVNFFNNVEATSIAFDEQGNKWFGTSGGLVKFDEHNWTVYTTSNSGLPDLYVNSIAVDLQGNKWIGTMNGLAKFDGENWTVYKSSNSGLPSSIVTSMAIDEHGIKWIGTMGGLARFDGQNWTVYSAGLPDDDISSVAVGQQGKIWIGTISHGIAALDGENLTVYNPLNSGLLSFWITAIAADKQGNTWIGSQRGVAPQEKGQSGLSKFDGQNWTGYTTGNSGLPGYYVNSIAFDSLGNKWIGTENGLAKFDGQNWTVYNSGNSGLPHSWIYSVAVDKYGNKWIGTQKGISVFREEGVILSDVKKDNSSRPESFLLSQNYPNPFNPSTTINYSIPEGRFVTMKVYDMLGKEVSTLLNEYKQAGNHSVQFKASSLPSGIYIYTIQAGEFRDSKKLVLLK